MSPYRKPAPPELAVVRVAKNWRRVAVNVVGGALVVVALTLYTYVVVCEDSCRSACESAEMTYYRASVYACECVPVEAVVVVP